MPRGRNYRQLQELEDLSNSLSGETSRSDTPPDAPPNLLDMNELVRALREDRPTRREIKPPQFSGQGDVELFLSQFRDVAVANQWTDQEYALHLRLSLIDRAADCSRAEDRTEIEQSLRAQFGLSTRQAREKIRLLQRGPKQSVHELGTEAKKLVRLAYPGLQAREQEDMAIEVFIQALDNKSVKRHFLASPADSVSEAIEKVNEFLEASDSHSKTRVHAISREGETPQPALSDPTIEMLKSIYELLKKREDTLDKLLEQQQARKPPQPAKCYLCNGSHYKRDCPKLQNQPRQGNFSRPATQ